MNTDKLFKHIKEYLFIYAFIVQIVVFYTVTNSAIKDHEKRLAQLESTKVQDALYIAEINSRLASIETSLVFIKERLQ